MTTEDNNSLLIDAARDGNACEVQRLIGLGDPHVNASEALVWSAERGHTQCVRLLISVSNPRYMESEALYLAALNGHNDCIDLLFDCSDSVSVLDQLKDTYTHHMQSAKFRHLEEKVCAQQQKERIHQHIAARGVTHTKKM